jgi:hypothetical protein
MNDIAKKGLKFKNKEDDPKYIKSVAAKKND